MPAITLIAIVIDNGIAIQNKNTTNRLLSSRLSNLIFNLFSALIITVSLNRKIAYYKYTIFLYVFGVLFYFK